MSVVDALRTANARTEQWADAHPFAVIQGVLFGVTYGTLSAVFSIQ